jgi:hypothetical protein
VDRPPVGNSPLERKVGISFMWVTAFRESPRCPIDRSKDLTVTWTGGIPGTQVTLVGASSVNGVTAGFLCAAPVSAGQMTVPAYVVLTLSPTGSSIVPGQLVLGNGNVTAFTASGLDIASIAFGARYTVSLKFE